MGLSLDQPCGAVEVPVSPHMLLQYSQRFGQPSEGEAELVEGLGAAKGMFDLQKPAKGSAAQRNAQASGPLLQTQCGCPAGRDQKSSHDHKDWAPDFGYAVGTEAQPMYARFDTRDETCLRLGGFMHGQVVTDDASHEFVVVGVKPLRGKLRLWLQPTWTDKPGCIAFIGDPAAALQASHPKDADGTKRKLRESSLEDFDAAEDSDGEQVQLCRQCHLPLGELAYNSSDKTSMHGECLAQFHVRGMNERELARRQKDAAVKQQRHAEYSIGWDVQQIPPNLSCAAKLQSSPVSQHMCCLTLDESGALRIAATMEPAAAVNLEYLATALQVRRQEGKDALFSLDPLESTSSIDGSDMSMQRKRFEPSWLAGTSMGEVMFQADYHLKELSMGEHEQPIVGMRSCFDFFSEDGGHSKDWSAREWFVVRKADIFLSEDNALLPYIKMGVEAREQIRGDEGMEDAPITRAGHPLVKYARDFTHNFDLIAERKSVIYHLREVAKASILGKYLLESGICLDDAWFQHQGDVSEACCLDIPQLWNERYHSQIHVRDGKVEEAEKGVRPRRHGVYGGVTFSLDRFTVGARPVTPSARGTGVQFGLDRVSVTTRAPVIPQARAVQFSAISGPGVGERMSALIALSATAAGLRTPVLAGLRTGPPVIGAPAAGLRGVDLNLDQFDLELTQATGKHAVADVQMPIGNAFWPSICDDTGSVFKSEDAKLLRQVFNPELSDRRSEGELFIPPETSFSYVQQLRGLVKEEETVREKRKQHFLDRKFMKDNAGPLFPSSWQASFRVAPGTNQRKAPKFQSQGTLLHARPDYLAHAARFDSILKATEPEFDKATEDGARFRIYRFGSLEIRTTQELDGQEAIGAVFSIRTPLQPSAEGTETPCISGDEQVLKATEYAEHAQGPALRRSYVVLETAQGNEVVTEKLEDGTATWEENPPALEVRNSFAKVLRSVNCDVARATLKDMKSFHDRNDRPGCGASAGRCKRYARGAYDRAQALQVHVSSAPPADE